MRPGIYSIAESEFNKQKFFNLVPVKERFELPDKIYGDIMDNVIRVWNNYAITKKTTGVLYSGLAGTSKTLSAMLLSNIAIDNDLAVVMCTEIRFDLELLGFLNSLSNVVLFMDEFRKNMDWSIQEKALTMLSDINSTHKLIVMTENSVNGINSYILNRPGRIRYHFNFDKLSHSVFKHYCSEHDVVPSFYKELEEKYLTYKTFSFDQLQAIITEHLHYPNDSLDKLLEILNLHDLQNPRMFVIKKCYNSLKDEPLCYEYIGPTDLLKEGNFKSSQRGIYLEVFKDNSGSKQQSSNEPTPLTAVRDLMSFGKPLENMRKEVYICYKDLVQDPNKNNSFIYKTRISDDIEVCVEMSVE